MTCLVVVAENIKELGVVVRAGGHLHPAPLSQYLRPVECVEVKTVVELGIAGELTESAK